MGNAVAKPELMVESVKEKNIFSVFASERDWIYA